MYLNCKTYFSFQYGTYGTEELVTTATEQGIDAMAITNINSTCDVWDFVDFCKQQHIKPIAGVEIRNESTVLYILLAKNNKGFSHINRFLSGHLAEKKPFPEKFIYHDDVYVIYPFTEAVVTPTANEYIGVQPAEVNKLYTADVALHRNKYIILHPVTFQNKTYYNVHRLLRAIDKNIILSKQQKEDIAAPHETFIPPSSILESFKQYPFIVTNTLQLIDSCSIDLEFYTDKTKKIYSASKEDDRILLEKLTLRWYEEALRAAQQNGERPRSKRT